MNPAFDTVATSYDQEFTDTPIGRAQRDRVWRYMRKVLGRYERARILELNCGTGEDAVFMAGLGHDVVATDISTEMLKQTQQKAEKAKLQDKIQVKQLDLAAPELEGEAPFDVIFSNFGGLNCLSINQFQQLSKFISNILNPGGACVFVIMPPQTFLEKMYRWWKKELPIYQKRMRDESLPIHVNGVKVLTYFHSISRTEAAFEGFKIKKSFPAGFVPSYLNGNRWTKILLKIDSLACWLKVSGDRADHFVVHFCNSKR